MRHYDSDNCSATPHGQILLTPHTPEGRRHAQMVIAGIAVGQDPARAADPADRDVSYAVPDCRWVLDLLGLLGEDDDLRPTQPFGRRVR